MSNINYSELFYSLQGEGRFVGAPSVFLRTFGCNFRCKKFGRDSAEVISGHNPEVIQIIKKIDQYKNFDELPLVTTGCDSYATIYPEFKKFSIKSSTGDLVAKMLALTPNHHWVQDHGNDVHLVITGGEPLLGWQRAYGELLDSEGMRDLRNLTFETNGTQQLNPEFREYLHDWVGNGFDNEITFSVSPKLSASGESWSEAIRPEIVAAYQDVGFTYLKFVVETRKHIEEARKAVNEYRSAGFTGPVYLMPQGGIVEPYDKNKKTIADICCEQGWNYSPRLHVDLWGNGWGK